MVKAVELPDPLDKPPLGPNPNADELLAQMADEAIDRLLNQAQHQKLEATMADEPVTTTPPGIAAPDAEPALDAAGQAPVEAEGRADSFAPSGPPATESIVSPPSALPADVADPQLAAQFNELFEELNRSSASRDDAVQPVAAATSPASLRSAESPTAADAASPADAKGAPPAVEEQDATLARQLDALFEALTPGKPAPPAAAEPPLQTEAKSGEPEPPSVQPQAPAPATATAAAPAEAPVAAVASEPATQAAVDKASAPDQSGPLEPQVLADRALRQVAAQVRAEADVPVGGASPHTPLYIRVLELLNAPMAGCSDAARDLAGKVAIMTLLLAMAVLIWVMFFASP